jgi:ankyrin repeat protein
MSTNVRAIGKTALHYAAQSKNVAVVRALVQAGADVDAKMTGNVTPLMFSLDMAFGQPDIALVFIRAGADVHAQEGLGQKRDSLSQKGICAAHDLKPGRSGSAHRCR